MIRDAGMEIITVLLRYQKGYGNRALLEILKDI